MARFVVALFALSILGLTLVPNASAQTWNTPGLTLQQQTALVWREMSDCARQAQKQFGDHTKEGNAKREAARLDCLRRNHLPVTTEPLPYY
ncbi:MAG TPA: hypothetical protein VG328_04000 [Stellaceae bacterium]|jgi:ABC-type sugar transport system substrate-binding protein|nr:hypothetical protein [Stellaceae bacterium]